MSRSPRTTKKQKEHIVNFLNENRILLGGKISLLSLAQINKLWEQLAVELNNMGPQKSVKQWKYTISELKTNVKRRAREVRYGISGTGGGNPVKPLSEIEERLLALISNISIEGVEGLQETTSSTETPVDEKIQIVEVEVGEDEPSTSTLAVPMLEVPIKTTAPRPKALQQKLKIIRSARVEKALDRHDGQLDALTRSNFAIAKSLKILARAMNKIASKMNRWNNI